MHSHPTSIALALLAITTACNIGNKNLGESDEAGDTLPSEAETDTETDGETETGDPPSDLPEETELCVNTVADPGELCFSSRTLELPASVIDVMFDDVDDAGEFAIYDLVMLTDDPASPLVILHGADWGRLSDQPMAVAGPLPSAAIAGLSAGNFDEGTEYIDIVYANEAGVVIGWDKGLGPDFGFDDVSLAMPCKDPRSFAMAPVNDDSLRDIVCAREAASGETELLVAYNLGDRMFAEPFVAWSGLPDITPLRAFGPVLAHDRASKLFAWEVSDDGFGQLSYDAAVVGWDIAAGNLGGDNVLAIASRDPAGVLLMTYNAQDGYSAGELLTSDALPNSIDIDDLDFDLVDDVVVGLDSGHVGVWFASDPGVGELELLEVGPDPQRLAIGNLDAPFQSPEGTPPVMAIATANSDGTVTLLESTH